MNTLISPRNERTQPIRIVPGYPQTPWRNPKQPLIRRALTLSELTGPTDVAKRVKLLGGDIAGHGDRQAIGQLMHLKLRIVDEDGAPVGGSVVEIWQANGAGRYIHPNDDDHAPVDANFYGAARLLTDESGRHRPAHREARRLPGARRRTAGGGRRTSISRSSARCGSRAW